MILNVQISSPELTFQKETGKPYPLSNLKKGQLVTAKVMSVLSQNKARLLVSGQLVTAKTNLPLAPGAELALEVTQNKEGLSFRLSPASVLPSTSSTDSGISGSLVRSFGHIHGGLSELGKTQAPDIKNILQNIALKSGSRNDQFLPNLLENMGLALENKINTALTGSQGAAVQQMMDEMAKQDLKAAILSYTVLETDDGASTAMRGLSNALESFQQLNSQTGDANRFLLPFPVLVGEQFDFGQLLIDTGKKGAAGEENENRVIKIAFLMSLTALGNIRADFSILKKAITGRFLLEDRETRDYLNALVPELKHRLSLIDYEVRKIECQVAAPRELSSDALIQSVIEPLENSGFNLVI